MSNRPLLLQGSSGIPSYVDGRIVSTDFINFTFKEKDLQHSEIYEVALEDMDFDNRHGYKSLGPLIQPGMFGGYMSIKLPEMMYNHDTKILVAPKFLIKGKVLPRWIGTLERGKTYNLDVFNSIIGDNLYSMR